MAALLGYNRKLGWVVVPALLWACLALALALGAVQVGPPPGGMIVPGRVLRVAETAGRLILQMGYLEEQRPFIERWQRDILSQLPENLAVEFSVLERSEYRQPLTPEFQLRDPASEPHRFPSQREVVLTQEYILLISPREARLLPRGRDSEAVLRRLLEERRERGGGGPGWRERRKPAGKAEVPPGSKQPELPPATLLPGAAGPPPGNRPVGPPEAVPGGPPPDRSGGNQGRGPGNQQNDSAKR